MKFEFSFNYYAYFKRPRKPSWELCTMKSTSLATIREVDQAETVHAFTLKGLDERDTRFQPLIEKSRTYDVLVFEDAFYISRFSKEDVETRFTDLQQGPRSPNPLSGHAPMKFPEDHYAREAHVGWYDKDAPTTRAEAEKLVVKNETKKWVDYRDEFLKVSEKVLSSFIVSGDTVYQRINEPVIKILFNEQDESSIDVVVDEIRPRKRVNSYHDFKDEQSGIYFGIDEADRALGVAKTLSERTGRPRRVFASVEQAKARYVTYRGEADALYRFCNHAKAVLCGRRDSHSRTLFPHLQQAFMEAVYDFGRAVEKHESASPEIIRTASSLVSLFKAHGEKSDVLNQSTFQFYETQQFEDYYKDFEDVMRGLEERLLIYGSKEDTRLDWSGQALDVAPVITENLRVYEVTNIRDAAKCARELDAEIAPFVDLVIGGTGRIVASQDFMTGKTVAAGFYPAPGETAKKTVWVSSTASKDAQYSQLMEDYLHSADMSQQLVEDELAALGI